jgi:hypothetical protein
MMPDTLLAQLQSCAAASKGKLRDPVKILARELREAVKPQPWWVK